jgi:predicted transglutaminase-like cysteine proteinase
MMRFVRRAAIFTLLVVAGSDPLAATPIQQIGGAGVVRFGPVTPTPRGYYELCKRQYGVCRASRARGVATTVTGAVVLTDKGHRDLVAINAGVNRGMRSQSDRSRYGVADRWAVGGASGDCEDFALAKRMRLIRAGWPSTAALVAMAQTEAGEEHAVLIARTDRGDVVLDNLTNEIRGWKRSRLKFTSIQSPDHAWTWRKF